MKSVDKEQCGAADILPLTVRYYLVRSLGTPTGETLTVQRGDPLPAAPSGFAWQPETAAMLRGRAEELRKRARSYWTQTHADAMLALAEQLETRAAALEQAASRE